LREEVLRYALDNALRHRGMANPKAVLGKLLARHPEHRKDPRSVMDLVAQVVEEVNAMPHERQRELLESLGAPEYSRKERKSGLPDLPGVGAKVVMRFAPGPSGPLHIGHARAAVLNDEYVRRYSGEFVLRIEDTNPAKVMPEAYDWIPEDLEWLGVEATSTVLQSDRFELYYSHMERLLSDGHAYICTCDTEVWKELKAASRACRHRDLEPELQLEEWERMLDGTYGEHEAMAVVKTDLSHPNPAVRDWVAMRIVETPHPRTGDRYRVYPLMNFSVAVDDHHLGLTHVLRGKDHQNNTLRQEYVFRYFGWPLPEYIHYGRVRIEGVSLSTSEIREGIDSGRYSGWDDVQLPTLRAMARRGITPESLRAYWVDVGIKEVDMRFSWETLYSLNRSIVDRRALRYFFVWNPVPLTYRGQEVRSACPRHPEQRQLGYREMVLRDGDTLYLTGEDIAPELRLKDMCNIAVREDAAEYTSTEPVRGLKIVHWLPERYAVPCRVLRPDGTVDRGYCEAEAAEHPGELVQFERYGYVRVESAGRDAVVCVFTHP